VGQRHTRLLDVEPEMERIIEPGMGKAPPSGILITQGGG